MSESQKVTQQEALTTATGRTWLVVGGIISVLCLVLFWLMRDLQPLGAATTGIIITIVLYLAMVAIRFGVKQGPLRLWPLAVITISIAATFVTVACMMIFSN